MCIELTFLKSYTNMYISPKTLVFQVACITHVLLSSSTEYMLSADASYLHILSLVCNFVIGKLIFDM